MGTSVGLQRIASHAVAAMVVASFLFVPTTVARALPRAGHNLVLDATRNRVLLFGGRDGRAQVTNEVFTFGYGESRPDWRPLQVTGSAPAPRELSLAAFIPVRNQLLVVGGQAPAVGTTFTSGSSLPQNLTDVWILHLEPVPRWEELHPAGLPPSPRSGAAGAYDSAADRFLLQGGRDSISNQETNELWELQLSPSPVWRRLEPVGDRPPPCRGHQAAFDARHNEFVIWGGLLGGYKLWRLPLSGELAWKACELTGGDRDPASRWGAATAYDSLRNAVAVFGGGVTTLGAPDLGWIHLGVINETPGCCPPICHVERERNPNLSQPQGPGVMIRPAPEPRAYAGLVTLPRLPAYEQLGEQLVALVVGGRQYMSQTMSWSLLGPVYSDTWGLFQKARTAGSPVFHEWRLMSALPDTTATQAAVTSAALPDFPTLLPQHAAALRAWLRSKPTLRVMSLADLKFSREDLDFYQKQHGPERHPCYVRGDFNRDRVQDFAVLLYDRTTPRAPGALAIFNGRANTGMPAVPSHFERGSLIDRWQLWTVADGAFTTLFEGIAESDNLTWFEWKGRVYVHKAPDGE